MVSPIWKAAADGDVNKLRDLLKDATPVDIEIKDHTGSTPLIQAVKNGHLDVVKELIARGADPTNASSQGKPEAFTQDPAILEVLRAGGNVNGASAPNGALDQDGHANGYDHNAAAAYPPGPNGAGPYWYMPNGPYPPYGYMPPPPDGVQHPMPPYYPQQQPMQPPQQGHDPSQDGHRQDVQQQQGNSPVHMPPEVARTIPCRFFPMCKFGSSCMFFHPPAPYYTGPPPPVPYPAPYAVDGVSHQAPFPPHPYYPVPPPQAPGFPPPTPITPSNAGQHSPVQHTNHAAAAPPAHVPFTTEGPTAVPYPFPPPPHPVSMSPTASFHAPPPPQVVIPVQPTFTQPVSPTHHRKESSVTYPQVAPAQVNGFAADGQPKQAFPEDGPRTNGSHFVPRENNFRKPGGYNRKISFNGPRQPCLFFPAGKCKNGNDCRFPHVRPEEDPAAFGPEGYPPQNFPQRSGPRAPRPLHTQRSFGSRDDAGVNGVNGYRKYPADQNGGNFGGPRGPYQPNGFNRTDKFAPRNGAPPAKEKVLSPADFPSLNGSITPTSTTATTNGGLTAAQVLKRNTPSTVKEVHEDVLSEAMAKVTINGGANGAAAAGKIGRADSPDLPAPVFASINDNTPTKLVAAA